MKKIFPLKDLKFKISRLKRQKKKIVFTNGCFDIIHNGHVRVLKKAKSFGDILVVAINDDRSVRRLKGENRPIFPLRERAGVLASFEYVDYIVSFSQPTPIKVIKALRPDILVKGGDYRDKDIVGSLFIKESGGSVKRVPIYKNYSSSRILKEITRLF